MNRDILKQLNEVSLKSILQKAESLKLYDLCIFLPVKSNQADKLHIQVKNQADIEDGYIKIVDLSIEIEDILQCDSIILLKDTLEKQAIPQIIGKMIDLKLENLTEIQQLLSEQCLQWEAFQRNQQNRYSHFQFTPVMSQPSQVKPKVDVDYLSKLMKQAVERDEYARQCLRENPVALKEALDRCNETFNLSSDKSTKSY